MTRALDEGFRASYLSFLTELGIDALGVVSAGRMETFDIYNDIIRRGVPAQLSYLEKNAHCRADVSFVLSSAKTVICAAVALPAVCQTPTGRYAQFCFLGDYHAALRTRLSQLADYLKGYFDIGEWRVCVDSAPLPERELAVRAGLGEIGRNHQVIHRILGSHCVLGELLVDVDLMPYGALLSHRAQPFSPDGLEPGKVRCCAPQNSLCARHCPTGALGGGSYDFSRCLSYWSTQHRGKIPFSYARAMDDRIWGCDACQQHCPRACGKLAPPQVPSVLTELTFDEIFTLSGKALTRRLAGTPLGDASPNLLVRNACIVLANTRNRAYLPQLHDLSQNHHCEWVRETAAESLALLSEGRQG